MAGTGEEPQVERDYFQELSVRFSVGYELLEKEHVEPLAAVSRTASGRVGMGPLAVESLDMKEWENAKTHHTDRYQQVQRANPVPVLRRGQPFQCAVRFDRAPDIPRDVIRLVFDIGSGPSVSKGTRVVLDVGEGSSGRTSKSEWSIKLVKRQDTVLIFQVMISVWAPVGAWRLFLQTVRGSVREDFRYGNFVFILFNPWNPDDGVYLENDDLRNEYVMNDYGKVWMGTAHSPVGRPWLFGQFHDVALPACALLMERTHLPHSQRWDPIQFSRAVSAVVNANDDNGLILGRWMEPYHGGTHPLAWTGTVAIMEQFLKNGHHPVGFGQCWVFSAATVTVCRALGLPCRSITNFESPHDTDGSMTTDYYFDRRGDQVWVRGSRDHVWNYHVWNEVWMRRPDLPSGHDGWQLVDGTPQEPSKGLFRCGPTSVKAVRQGIVGLPYDGPYVYAEVNADTYYFTEDYYSPSGFVLTSVDTYSSGRRQITKMAGSYDNWGISDLEDVTAYYKAPEGSAEEREVNRRALSTIRGGRMMASEMSAFTRSAEAPEDVSFELMELEDVLIGKSFNVVVKFHNKSEETRTITCILKVNSIYYNGTEGHKIRHVEEKYTLEPEQCIGSLEVQVNPEEYVEKLVEQSYIKIFVIAEVEKTGQKWIKEKVFELQIPKMSVQPLETELRSGDMINVEFSFRNPLNLALSRCSATIECPDAQVRKLIELDDVPPGETISFAEQFQSTDEGEMVVLAIFTSEQLCGVVGSYTLNVPS